MKPQFTPISSKTHQCAACGCKRKISTSYVMCHDHWHALPEVIRLDVWKWFAAKTRGVPGAAAKAQEARQKAVRWLSNRDARAFRASPAAQQRTLFKV